MGDFFGAEMKRQKSSQADEEASLRLIQQLLKNELCVVCGTEQGHPMHGEDHKICMKCGYKYLMKGLKSNKWSVEPLTCPVDGCDKAFPQHLLTKASMNISADTRNAILGMQENIWKS